MFGIFSKVIIVGVALIIGLQALFKPYDEFLKAFPNAPSKPVVKILGAIAVLCAVIMAAVFIWYYMG